MHWYEDSTKWVWNVHICFEQIILVYNYEETLKTVIENSVNKNVYRYRK